MSLLSTSSYSRGGAACAGSEPQSCAACTGGAFARLFAQYLPSTLTRFQILALCVSTHGFCLLVCLYLIQ